jgi:hypothetical protein
VPRPRAPNQKRERNKPNYEGRFAWHFFVKEIPHEQAGDYLQNPCWLTEQGGPQIGALSKTWNQRGDEHARKGAGDERAVEENQMAQESHCGSLYLKSSHKAVFAIAE